MILFTYLVVTPDLTAAPRPVRTPTYGMEGTITGDLLTRVNRDLLEQIISQIYQAYPENKLHYVSRTFPDEYALFEQFLSAAYGEEIRSLRHAHKECHPAYLRAIDHWFWVQYQFEVQAFELQTAPAKLHQFIEHTGTIDRTFYQPGRSVGLKPSPIWGMGHIHEGLGEGYPLDRPEVLYNRVVAEFNDIYFWTLVGPDVKARVQWDAHADRMVHFKKWMDEVAVWIEGYRTGDSFDRFEISRAVAMGINEYGIFAKADRENLLDLYRYAKRYLEVRRVYPPSVISRVRQQIFFGLLSALIKEAVTAISQYATNGAIFINPGGDLDDPDGDTLQFRRIPAQESGDEAAMWMRLLEGRWRRALRRRQMMVLERPTPPKTDAEKIEIFIRYIHSAKMNTQDFAKFLPPELRALLPVDHRYPRWSVLKEHIRCEAALGMRI